MARTPRAFSSFLMGLFVRTSLPLSLAACAFSCADLRQSVREVGRAADKMSTVLGEVRPLIEEALETARAARAVADDVKARWKWVVALAGATALFTGGKTLRRAVLGRPRRPMKIPVGER